MKRFITALCVVSFSALACNPKPPTETDYSARIAAGRATKDAAFKSRSEPVPETRKPELLPLVYYAIDPKYDVPAHLTPSDDARARPMVYSDGAIRNVRLVGTLTFLLNDQTLGLDAFVEVGAPEHSLFVPFGDLTNGTETYPGGRILDVERTLTGIYDLDFNLAYNPNCYYSPTYSCPVPPKQNRLAVPIKAGERIRVDH
jgi:uncharacterized protein (DUF1684 family)